MGMRAEIFREKLEKKGHPFDFFDPYNNVVLTEVTFFSTKYGLDSRGFFLTKLKKMTLEHRVFDRMYSFFTKYGNDGSEFFGEWTFS